MNVSLANDISALTTSLKALDEFVFLDCARLSDEEYRSYLFTQPRQWLSCTEPKQAMEFVARADAFRAEGYYLAGWLGYEFGYLLEPSLRRLCPPQKNYALLGVFETPLTLDHRQTPQFFPPEGKPEKETGTKDTFTIEHLRTSMEREEYLQAIDRIKEYIVAGDTYQVNFTLKLLFNFNGSCSAFYKALRRNQAVSYGAWIKRSGQDVMSFSPELFFRANDKRITVRPMKGTMKRGRTLAEDEQQRKRLAEDLKNRSENVMIVDLLRNDLGRLLHAIGGGRVQPRSLFDVEVYDTVLQMTSTVDGVPFRDAVPALSDILPALFPCGSVTGAPKIRTMEIINELENQPRGVYCGAIGFYGPDEAVFNVPIRTVVLDGEKGEMGVGSGIVFDSDPESEWQESLLKAQFLTTVQPEFQLIETLLWQPDTGYWLLDKHLHRLADSADYFLFCHDNDTIIKLLEEEACSFTKATRVRLLLHRDGRMTVSSTEVDANAKPITHPEVSSCALPKVIFSTVKTDPTNIHLYHKTTHRELYVEERAKTNDAGYYEVLFTNSADEVTEGSITNIFVLKDGRLRTPPVSCGLLNGTFRQYLLSQGKVEEGVLRKTDIENADAVYIGNSVRGLVQVEVVNNS